MAACCSALTSYYSVCANLWESRRGTRYASACSQPERGGPCLPWFPSRCCATGDSPTKTSKTPQYSRPASTSSCTPCVPRAYPQTLLFLAAYLLYNDGIQSVIALAATYGSVVLELEQSTLISAILMVQFVAFLGALVLGAFARLFGAKRVVLASLILWTGVVAVGYFLQAGSAWQFYLLSALIGIVLGGSQALSRSLFSHMIPTGQEAAYFSLYEISERGTSWLGPLVFGLMLQLTGSYRSALLSLVAFFVAGFALLAVVNVRRAIVDSGNPLPERV